MTGELSTVVDGTITSRREFLTSIRREVRRRRSDGEAGIPLSQWFSDRTDELLQRIVADRLAQGDAKSAELFCLAAVGGNGRRRPAPYSDVDLLIVTDSRSGASTQRLLSDIIRDFWDVKLQVGHSVRTPADIIRFASADTQFATSLADMRFVAGHRPLLESTAAQVRRLVFRDRPERLIRRFVDSRREEWLSRGNSVNQLEPDIKRSPGGLRDLHVLQWVAFSRYGFGSLSELLEHHEISEDELRSLELADEYLTGLRLDLHCARELKQDVLTRELQLMIADRRQVVADAGMRAVEVFMKEYFRHTSRVSEVATRVAEPSRQLSMLGRLKQALRARKLSPGYQIVDGVLLVPKEQLALLDGDPLAVMNVFGTAAEQNLVLSPDLRRHLGALTWAQSGEPERQVSERFRDMLRCSAGLPGALRAMYETGFLVWLIPQFEEIRCRIEFNQYHSFTVDEHTLKAMDELTSLAAEESPAGSAWRSVRHKATLHLSLLMHDIGKGRVGDHSVIGAEICDQVAVRLQMAENKKTMLRFLVRHHLDMSNLAFRRDISDSAVLVEFARLVGAPELLRMLYVLTVADIRAVGPDVWSDWKGELLADLYNRTMQILSGRPYNHLEQDRLKVVRETVCRAISPVSRPDGEPSLPNWIEQQLDALPPFYLMTEHPEQIARDLSVIQSLSDSAVKSEGEYEPETATVTYRVFAPLRYSEGAFHKIAGMLSGLRMNILAAQICTTADSTVIASFRVTDNDFSGEVPESRIEDVATAIRDVLTAKRTVESVFRRSSLIRCLRKSQAMTFTEPHVSFDNDCSERFTVVDVFASDRQGLLYMLAHVLHDHGLHVCLARIATHIDQVVDVFYVVDKFQRKLEDPARIADLRTSLLREIRLLN